MAGGRLLTATESVWVVRLSGSVGLLTFAVREAVTVAASPSGVVTPALVVTGACRPKRVDRADGAGLHRAVGLGDRTAAVGGDDGHRLGAIGVQRRAPLGAGGQEFHLVTRLHTVGGGVGDLVARAVGHRQRAAHQGVHGEAG